LSDVFSIRIPSVKRKKTSIAVDPLIWDPFVVACHNNGDSTCGVLEPYMFAYTMATRKGVPVQAANLTLNLTVVREVQRPRRRVSRGRGDVELVDAGSLTMCSICRQMPLYVVTRWPNPNLCISEYICDLHYHRFKRLFPEFGIRRL